MSFARTSRHLAVEAFAALAAAVFLAAAPAPAAAQGLSGTDIIIGSVKGEDGAPIQDATVEAYSLETQVVRRAHTDAKGRFTILFPDGGGQYRMTARVLGMTPHAALLVRDADEDRLVWNVRLSAGAVALDAVDVRTGPQLRAGEGPTPGSTERGFNPDQLAQMPIDITDLSVLAGLVPGVLPIGATDTTATAFSVAGLGADANAVTLDGLLFGNSSVPQEGLRNTRVVTSTYDVSRGSFSGGLVASTTRSGSNFVAGSSQYQLRDEGLSVDAGDTPYTQGFNQNVISGGLGGALVHDRLFLMVSGQARLRSDPQQTLLSAGPTDFTRLGVAPDSVQRFTGLVSGLGVPYNSVSGLDTRANDSYSGLARLDLVLSTSHTITLRGDYRGTSLDPARLGALALPQTGGKTLSSGGGAMLTLTSHFGATVLNELRGYLQGSKNNGDPFSQLPAGRVQVASALPDSTVGVTTLTFGGNTGMPSSSRSSSFEGSDEVSWLPGSGMHRIKIGASLLTERTHDLLGNNLLGTYTYNSLADLQSGLPATFRRTLDVTERQSDNLRWGMYAGDVWFVTRPFQLTYGARLEGSSFGDPPAYNPVVDTVFGHRTDRLPTEWHLSPRAGFTWTIGGSQGGGGFGGGRGGFGGGGGGGGGGFGGFQPARYVIRGGFGEFRSQPSSQLVAQARSATGLPSSASEIVCIGSGVPTPDWGAYWANPDSIPDQCGSGVGPAPAGFQAARSVTLLAPDFEAPRAWRGSLSVERRLTNLLRLTVEGSFARGVAQTGYADLNLVSHASIFLGNERARPVYVSPADIVPSPGAAIFSATRMDSVFGRVLLASSNFVSMQEQVTDSISGVFGRAI
ncbi:MAG: carboxypeptidase regulatory-like domain-containing protein, partial [Gemmatimonadales bacterium]